MRKILGYVRDLSIGLGMILGFWMLMCIDMHDSCGSGICSYFCADEDVDKTPDTP